MKIFFLSTAILLSTAAPLFSQDIQGKAVYQSHGNLKINTDSIGKNISEKVKSKEVKKKFTKKIGMKLGEIFQKAIEKGINNKFVLKFNPKESFYKQKESLSKPRAGKIKVTFKRAGASNVVYHNITKQLLLSKKSILGKSFLVKDTLQKPEWYLVNESKKIGKYVCFKATLTREVQVADAGSFFSEDSTKNETHTETRTTTAWYTPQIPVHHGPGKYWGLPGLILQVQKGHLTILCTKVILNPKKEIQIEKPSQGEIISREAFKKLREKKMNQLWERHSSEDGTTITIKKD